MSPQLEVCGGEGEGEGDGDEDQEEEEEEEEQGQKETYLLGVCTYTLHI